MELPPEMLAQIFLSSEAPDLLQSSLVCKEWNLLIETFVWKSQCYRRWNPSLCQVDLYNNWKELYLDSNMKNKAAAFFWDSNRCGRGILLSNDRKVAIKTWNGEPSCQVLCSQPCFGREKFYFEVEILATSSGAINIGVCGSNSDLERRCGFDSNGWSMSLFSGDMFHNNQWKSYSKLPRQACKGDRLGVGIDMMDRHITFFFNGVSQGTALSSIDGLPELLYVSLSLSEGDCVAIISSPLIPDF